MRIIACLVFLLAAVPARAGAVRWQCEARPLVGTPVYLGSGATELEAKANADHQCRSDGHLVCFVDDCEQVTD